MGTKITIDMTKLAVLGGKARAAKMTPEERRASAKAAIKARWDAYYKQHPEKRKKARRKNSA